MEHHGHGIGCPARARQPWTPAAIGALLLLAAAAGAAQDIELTQLVDSPTAGLLGKGQYGFDLRLFAGGGVAGQVGAGALPRLAISVAYGGEGVLGNLPADWYPRLEAGIRYRLVEESAVWPAVVIGYDTQGYGAHRQGRYASKSKGLFGCTSKNYASVLGQFGLHAGINLTRETEDGDDDVSGWLGVDKSINEQLALVAEYDLGRNADGRSGSGLDHPLLHAGVRLSIAPQLTLALHLKDLLTQTDAPQFTRELSVHYVESF